MFINTLQIKKALLITGMFYIGLQAPTLLAEYQTQPNISYNRHTGAYLGGDLGVAFGGATGNSTAKGGAGLLGGVGGTAFLGYQFNPYFGVEGDFVGASLVGFDALYAYGATLRGTLPLGKRIGLYIKGGIGGITVHESCDLFFCDSNSTTFTQVAGLLGAGLSVALTQHAGLMLDYTGSTLFRNNIGGVAGLLGLGFTYSFNNI